MALTILSSVWPPSRSVGRNVFLTLFCRVVAETMIRSPAIHPVTRSAHIIVLFLAFAGAPSLTQVWLSGAPWKSMRPPQQTMAGHDSLSIPETRNSRMRAVQSAPMACSGVPPGQGAAHVERAEDRSRLDVVDHSMAWPDLHLHAGAGDLAAFPGARSGPGPA